MVKLRLLLRNAHMYANGKIDDDKFIEIPIDNEKLEYLLGHGYFVDKVWTTTEKEELMFNEIGPIIDVSD